MFKSRFAIFVADRLSIQSKGTFSNTVSKIIVLSSAVSIFVILISYAILLGFQKNIKDKIFTFSGHIQISKFSMEESMQVTPLEINTTFLHQLDTFRLVKYVYTYSIMPVLVKQKDEVNGLVVKGVDDRFNKIGFEKHIKQGRMINWADSTSSNEILVSNKTAQKMNLNLEDNIIVFFLHNPPKFRKLKIVGIFNTGMEEFDESVIFADLKLLQKVNDWPANTVGGYEILLKRFDDLNIASEQIYEWMDFDLALERITDKYVNVFDWLELLSQNVKIFLIVILFISCFNSISCLLIMIMERTSMIGLFKAMGAKNITITQLFMWQGLKLIAKGVLIGNIVAFIFCIVQWKYELLPLGSENYYMEYVPIAFNIEYWFWSNIFFVLLLIIALLLPLAAIVAIKPAKAIRYA